MRKRLVAGVVSTIAIMGTAAPAVAEPQGQYGLVTGATDGRRPRQIAESVAPGALQVPSVLAPVLVPTTVPPMYR
jgi:hypothetical protein